MKTVLSVDVGLKNLGICVMNVTNSRRTVLYWKVLNVFDEDSVCQGHLKNGKECKFKAVNKTDSIVYCKKHTPPNVKVKKIKTRLVKNIPLQEIASRLHATFDEFARETRETLVTVEKVFIELQPKINNKMKFSSHIIFSKFVEFYREFKTSVVFESARNKLQVYKGPLIECNLKTAYSKRKYTGIEHTKKLLAKVENGEVLLLEFEKNKKKDDLADCFLMCFGKLDRV